MQEVEITIKARNNRLKSLRLAEGLSQVALGKIVGAPMVAINALRKLRAYCQRRKLDLGDFLP